MVAGCVCVLGLQRVSACDVMDDTDEWIVVGGGGRGKAKRTNTSSKATAPDVQQCSSSVPCAEELSTPEGLPGWDGGQAAARWVRAAVQRELHEAPRCNESKSA